MPKAYDVLLRELVHEIGGLGEGVTAGKSGRDLLYLSLRLAGKRAAARRGHGVNSPATLDERNFASTVETAAGAVCVRLGNCPFRSVARLEPAVCAFDASLIGTLLGAPVYRESCIADGARFCRYVTAGKRRSAPTSRVD